MSCTCDTNTRIDRILDETPGVCMDHDDPVFTIAVATEVVGELGYSGQEITVKPGVYALGDIDAGEALGLITAESGRDDVVWVSGTDLGLVDCVDCSGRGEFTYRIYEDDWESEGCDSCAGWGLVKPDVAEAQQRFIDAHRGSMPWLL